MAGALPLADGNKDQGVLLDGAAADASRDGGRRASAAQRSAAQQTIRPGDESGPPEVTGSHSRRNRERETCMQNNGDSGA
jgi:hypothetical protein